VVRLGDNDHAGNSAQEPGHERRSAPREVKDHARRLERRLAVESNEHLEPSPDEAPGARARRPVRNRLVEERFSETLPRQIGPVDRRGGHGKVEPDRCPAGEIGELHQSGRSYPEANCATVMSETPSCFAGTSGLGRWCLAAR
jgi:hypothetical protein